MADPVQTGCFNTCGSAAPRATGFEDMVVILGTGYVGDTGGNAGGGEGEGIGLVIGRGGGKYRNRKLR